MSTQHTNQYERKPEVNPDSPAGQGASTTAKKMRPKEKRIAADADVDPEQLRMTEEGGRPVDESDS